MVDKESRSRRLYLKFSVVGLALSLAVFGLPAGLVEAVYSNRGYLWTQAASTTLSNLIPFALVDLLVIALALGLPVWWIYRLISTRKGRRGGALARLAGNTVVATSLLFLAFQLLWGINYMRRPLKERLDYDQGRVGLESLKQLKRLATDRLNTLSAEVHPRAWPAEVEWQPRLKASLDAVVTGTGGGRSTVAAVPKTSLLEVYMGATGVTGFLNPFGHEVILDSELFVFEKPFVLAHEWAHLAGLANESEASFVGVLACVGSGMPQLQYAGWLAVYQLTPWPSSSNADSVPEEYAPVLKPEVIADLEAISERAIRRLSPGLSQAQEQIYDQYLRAHRVEGGIASYGLAVDLLLGTRFGAELVSAAGER